MAFARPCPRGLVWASVAAVVAAQDRALLLVWLRLREGRAWASVAPSPLLRVLPAQAVVAPPRVQSSAAAMTLPWLLMSLLCCIPTVPLNTPHGCWLTCALRSATTTPLWGTTGGL